MPTWYWIPVRVQQTGYVRVEADDADTAVELAEAGAISGDDLVLDEIESLAITGPPYAQETS